MTTLAWLVPAAVTTVTTIFLVFRAAEVAREAAQLSTAVVGVGDLRAELNELRREARTTRSTWTALARR